MLRLVVDTNLFHEFRALEELPWAELGEINEIELVVSEEVQTELDEHKKSPRRRLRRSAIKWTKRFREMLVSGAEYYVIQETDPRVVLVLDDTSVGSDYYNSLDLSNADDRLVGIAKKIADTADDAVVRLFSDDTRPLRKAKALDVGILPIPDEWRREPERTDEDKERDQLKAEIERLRLQEPRLVLSANVQTPVKLVVPSFAPLEVDQIEWLMGLLQDANPIETDFAREKARNPRDAIGNALSLGIVQYEFEAVSDRDIEKYTEDDYPAWQEKCRDLLEAAHERLGAVNRRFGVVVSLINEGTRPAQDLLISFSARGPIAIMPPPHQSKPSSDETAIAFPEAPKPPQGKWKKLDPYESSFSAFGQRFMPRDPFPLSHLFSPHVDRTRDPNDFFYRERPYSYVESFSLTCEQFRHGGDTEEFECLCVIDFFDTGADHGNAMLEVVVEAANLSDPEVLRLPIQYEFESRSTYDAVLELLDAAGQQE